VKTSSVAIVASVRDLVARRLARAIEQRGREVLFLDGPAASRLFTIRVSGRDSQVTPELPMFVRQSAWWTDPPSATADERFAANESYSALWSVAALSPAPVINKPDREGWGPELTAATLQPLLAPVPGQRMAEVWASSPERALAGDFPGAGLVLWGENLGGLTGPVTALPEGVPLRARPVDLDAAYEIITVVGERAFSATTDPRTPEFGLQERSVQMVRQAGSHFAAVTWSVGADAVPVRLNPDPNEGELRYSWAEVENALCADLTA
jgi:hypothetical protein